MRTIAVLLVLAQLVAGCATVRPSPPLEKTVECSEVAAKATDSGALKEGVVVGGLVGAWLILEGAAQGVGWGLVTGGSRSDGAWIGAAAGAGIGAIVGLAVGIKKGVKQHRRYRDAYESCLTERGYAATRTPAKTPGAS